MKALMAFATVLAPCATAGAHSHSLLATAHAQRELDAAGRDASHTNDSGAFNKRDSTIYISTRTSTESREAEGYWPCLSNCHRLTVILEAWCSSLVRCYAVALAFVNVSMLWAKGTVPRCNAATFPHNIRVIPDLRDAHSIEKVKKYPHAIFWQRFGMVLGSSM